MMAAVLSLREGAAAASLYGANFGPAANCDSISVESYELRLCIERGIYLRVDTNQAAKAAEDAAARQEQELILSAIEKELSISLKQVRTTVGLLDEGNTIPFIARYRKEMTGELDENVLRDVEERLGYLRNLGDRKRM